MLKYFKYTMHGFQIKSLQFKTHGFHRDVKLGFLILLTVRKESEPFEFLVSQDADQRTFVHFGDPRLPGPLLPNRTSGIFTNI